MSEPYRPIDCALHDELELRALRRTRCTLVGCDEAGGVRWSHAVIVDILTRSGEEFLRLDDGSEIRLDRIIQLDAQWARPAGTR